jgi:hypothetical protein
MSIHNEYSQGREVNMNYGNCLVCAFFIYFKERHNNPKFILTNRPGTLVPHFMVRSTTGFHHYKTVKDILPFPFCYLLFKGEFQTIPAVDGWSLEK